jgi:hypothetical protein
MSIQLVWPEKQTFDALDYSYDVTADVEPGDHIVKLVAAVKPSGVGELQIGGNTPPAPNLIAINGTLVTVWLDGGVGGRGYLVRIVVLMNSGRTFDILASLLMSQTLAPYPVPEPDSQDFGQGVSFQATTEQGTAVIAGQGGLRA